MGALCYLLSAGATVRESGHAPGWGKGVHAPITFAIADDIKTLDPGKMSWMNDIRVAMGMWEGLTAYDPATLKPIPGVAESWDISDGGTTYTFHLRQNARWSNGEAVTAKDFLFAWQRVLTPSTGADYSELFNCITGVKQYAADYAAYEEAGGAKGGGTLPDFASVGISSRDPYTITVHLVIPTNYFLDLTAFPPFFPLYEPAMVAFQLAPADKTQGYSGEWTRPPRVVSNGPYILADWRLGRDLTLEPNPQYWNRANVLCDRLTIIPIPQDERAALLAYETGTVDILSFVPADFGDDLLAQQREGKWPEVHYRPVFGTYYYAVNCKRPPLDDKRVRRALALAIDRQTIVDQVTRMHQKPITVLVPPDSIPGYQTPASFDPKGDVAEAKKLLAEAGFPDGHGMRSMEILFTNDVPIHGRIAQTIAQMWKENLGIDVTLKGLDRSGFSAARQQDHDFDISRGGWYGDYRDPTTWLDLCRSTNGNNDGQFSSPAYDALLDQAAAEHDPAKRLEILSQAESMLVNDQMPLIPLYQYSDGMIFDEKKFAGITANDRMLTPFKNLHRAP